MIDPMLLSILACPACQADVIEKDGRIACTNNACGLTYPVREGIPVMLVDEADTPDKPC